MNSEEETSKIQYKLIEHKNTIYQIPIRHIHNDNVLLLSDVQSVLPKAVALLTSHSNKLVPFQIDPTTCTEIIPKRILIGTSSDMETAWEAHVPLDDLSQDESSHLVQSNIEMRIKIDHLSETLEHIKTVLMRNTTVNTTAIDSIPENPSETRVTMNMVNAGSGIHDLPDEQRDNDTISEQSPDKQSNSEISDSEEGENNDEENDDNEPGNSTGVDETMSRSNSPPPAFSHNEPSSSSSHHEAAPPPSYETSVLSTFRMLNSKLELYESHIPNRYKSPKWLAEREEWLAREPASMEEFAFQLALLETALLWTAVAESWIEERDLWLTLVRNSRSERHLASAIINLERHTLVMDSDWATVRERWAKELLDMIATVPLNHG